MKRFQCDCGSQVFFDSDHCVACGRRLGFDPAGRDMRTLTEGASGVLASSSGEQFRLCDNGLQFGVCNWLRPADASHPLCFGCQFNRTVPNQSLPGNDRRWRVLEEGKKRLFFTLMQLGIPLVSGWEDARYGLLFDFIEDGRSRDMFAESFATTGYVGGVITINTLEADDVARTQVRHQMNESYRTVLGHLRHESGHYYWSRLEPDAQTRAAFNRVFGDETQDYAAALRRHYRKGAAADWRKHYISAYASAHPTEDWAECWGHYLHIYDALETAATQGLVRRAPDDMDMPERIATWSGISTTLNELNRSMGLGDAYPFSINRVVAEKLAFVDTIIRRLQTLR
jgi:hypothetical protein